MNKSVLVQFIRIGIFFGIFVLGFWQKSEATTLFLTEKKELYDLRGYAEFFSKHTDNINFDEFKDQTGKHLRNIKSDTFSIHWLKLNLINNSKDTLWFLSFGDTNEEVKLYVKDEYGNVITKECGNHIPFSRKGIKNGRSEFIDLHFSKGKEYLIFAKITNKTRFGKKHLLSDLISFQMHNSKSYETRFEYLNVFVAFVVGGLFIIFLYNCLLSFSLKSRSFYYYLLANLALIGYILFKYGLISQYIFPDSIFFEDKSLLYYFLPILTLSYVQFGRNFLQTKKFLPNIDKFIVATLFIQIFFCIWMFVFDWLIGRSFYLVFVLISNFVLLISAFYIYKIGQKYVIYYILADTLLILVSSVYIYCLIDIITSESIFIIQLEKVFLVAILIELIVYSFGIISNYKANERIQLEEKLTKEAQKQEEIHVKNYELEVLVRERTKKLRKAYRDLMNLNFELDTFVYRAAHDIRGPIATILGLCNLAIIEKDITKIHYYLQLLSTSTKSAELRLKKILSINEIKSSHVKPKLFSVKDLFEELNKSIKQNENTEKIEIQFSSNSNDNIYSEKNLITLIITNLVNNSIKYCQHRPDVYSFCKIDFDINERGYIFKISDNGNGIEESIKDRIFDMFFRASESANGAGLGLFIAKVAAKKLKGDIQLLSWHKGNTVFEVIIPFVVPKNSEHNKSVS